MSLLVDEPQQVTKEVVRENECTVVRECPLGGRDGVASMALGSGPAGQGVALERRE